MRSENYRNYFESTFMMGPNCLKLWDEILREYSLHYTSDNECLCTRYQRCKTDFRKAS